MMILGEQDRRLCCLHSKTPVVFSEMLGSLIRLYVGKQRCAEHPVHVCSL